MPRDIGSTTHAPAAVATLLDSIALGGRNHVRSGDQVRVLPSKPGRHDGFVADVRRIVATPSGLVEVEVLGAPVGRPRAFRTFTPDRLRRVRRTEARP